MKDEAEVSGDVAETLERLSKALKNSTAHDCPDEQSTPSEVPSPAPHNSGETKPSGDSDA